jgi:DNA polymerase III epsilon subunit family exonuclease
MWKSWFKNITPRKKEFNYDPLSAYVGSLCANISDSSRLKISLSEITYCIVDLETTGLDIKKDVIINAAAVKVKRGRITKIYEAYVKPPLPIPVESMKWHGISDDMLVDKPTIGEVLPELLSFIGNSVITGHHINFDINMLNRHLQETYSATIDGAPWLDTMLLHKLVMENNTSTELDDLLSVYVVDCDERHRALGDAVATTKVFLRILEELSPSYQTLGDLFSAQHDMSRKDNL